MPCYSPVQAWKPLLGGAVLFSERKDCREVQLACGQCIGCRIDRAHAWSVRILHESKMHPCNSFLTLTYDDEHLPSNGSLNYPDFQRFMRKLRRALPGRIRFYMCGEYGENTERPHYHAILFGVDFAFDRKRSNSVHSSSAVYESPTVAKCWPWGFHSIGAVTEQSARYVSSYCVKKVTGSRAEEHYKRVVTSTGEIVPIEPEFARMSLKPGLGAKYFAKYGKEIATWDNVVIDGREVPVPRFYYQILETENPDRLDEIKYERFLRANTEEHSPHRLAVREKVAQAKYSFYRKDKL